MAGFFVKPEDRVSVDVWFGLDSEGKMIAENKESACLGVQKPEKAVFVFRKPAHKDSNAILSVSGVNEDGIKNMILFQSAVISILLVDWDVKDEKGEVIPFNKNEVANVDPSITRAAVAGALMKISI